MLLIIAVVLVPTSLVLKSGEKNPHSKKRAVWIKQILANKDQLIAVTGFQHFVLALTILIFAVLLSFDFPSRHCSIALSSAARLY